MEDLWHLASFVLTPAWRLKILKVAGGTKGQSWSTPILYWENVCMLKKYEKTQIFINVKNVRTTIHITRMHRNLKTWFLPTNIDILKRYTHSYKYLQWHKQIITDMYSQVLTHTHTHTLTLSKLFNLNEKYNTSKMDMDNFSC